MEKYTVKNFLSVACLAFFTGLCFSMSAQKVSGFVGPGDSSAVKVDTLAYDFSKDIAEQMLPLDTIIDIAFQNSPALFFEDAMIDEKVWNMRYMRAMFFQGWSLYFNYSFGNTALDYSGTNPLISYQLTQGFRTGFSVQLPLSEIFGRSKRVKQARAELHAAQWRKEKIRLELKKEVIDIYFNMVTAQRKLNIRIDDAQASYMSYKVAEVNMEQGRIDPTEFARVRNIYAIAQNNIEMERGDFLKYFFLLEALVGVDISTLKAPEKK